MADPVFMSFMQINNCKRNQNFNPHDSESDFWPLSLSIRYF